MSRPFSSEGEMHQADLSVAAADLNVWPAINPAAAIIAPAKIYEVVKAADMVAGNGLRDRELVLATQRAVAHYQTWRQCGEMPESVGGIVPGTLANIDPDCLESIRASAAESPATSAVLSIILGGEAHELIGSGPAGA